MRLRSLAAFWRDALRAACHGELSGVPAFKTIAHQDYFSCLQGSQVKKLNPLDARRLAPVRETSTRLQRLSPHRDAARPTFLPTHLHTAKTWDFYSPRNQC